MVVSAYTPSVLSARTGAGISGGLGEGWSSRRSLRCFRTHALAALLVFLAALYANTGTLVPMALTGGCLVDNQTGYIYNSDLSLHLNNTKWLLGRIATEQVDFMILRRVLWHLLVAPFFVILGWDRGGFVLNVLLHAGAFLFFAVSGRSLYGERATIWMLWLLATFPAVGYFFTDMSYAIIVPACLVFMVLIEHLNRANSWRRIAALSLAAGVLCLGYDLAVFFAPAVLVLFGARRRWGQALMSAALILLPLSLWMLILKLGYGQGMKNPNSSVYFNALLAYRDFLSWEAFRRSLGGLPATMAKVTAYATYTHLTILAAACLLANVALRLCRWRSVESALLLPGLTLMAFANLAPQIPNDRMVGWMLRGPEIARIYLPIFMALLLIGGRMLGAAVESGGGLRWSALFAGGACVVANGFVCFGLLFGNPGGFAARRHGEFYGWHSPSHVDPRLQFLGRRPFGFRRPVAALDGMLEGDARRTMRMIDHKAMGEAQPAQSGR